MRRALRIVVVAVILLVVVAGGLAVWLQHPLIAAIEPPAASAFDPADVERGARLAALGNCDVCHTVPGGADYAGNRPIPTPFGTIYSTNITAAPGTGIGRWSEEAFRRAMREGVSRRGRHLYPAFPYDHYTRLGDDDLHALYAFLMTRPPVETFQRPNEPQLLFAQTWLMTLWNLLFLDESRFRADPQRSAEWNRGAYLVAGLGHCGACHTPRNLLAAEKTSQALSGGDAGEGWRAPALNASSPAPVPWDEAHLFAYLRHGWDPEHGAAAGPMQPVIDGLARADESDVRAIAAYLAAQQGEISPERRRLAAAARERAAGPPPRPMPGEEQAAAIFDGACAACHAGGPPTAPPRGINLALSTAISDPDPRNAIRIVLDGIRPGEGRAGPWMPGFAGAFTDTQLAAVLAYIRAHYGNGRPWADLAAEVRNLRGRTR
ncbi:MAG TPA: cytochrome c [Stellaceae bacterium]|nr:cytochrome c [Stellaceae bacterium]